MSNKDQKSLSCMNSDTTVLDKFIVKMWLLFWIGVLIFTAIVVYRVQGTDYLKDGLIDYWDFYSNASGNFAGNTFTFQNTPTHIAHAYVLDPGDALVNNTVILPDKDKAVTFYIRFNLLDTGSTYYSIFSRTPVSSLPQPYDMIWINDAGDHIAWAVGNGTVYNSDTYLRNLQNSNISISIVKTGNFTYDWYVDGTNVKTSTHTIMPVDSLSNPLRIGARADGLNTNMIVYAFGIWNRTLNSSEETLLYASGTEPDYSTFLSSASIPQSSYNITILNFSANQITNQSINLTWILDTNSTVLNLTLYRNNALIYNTTNQSLIINGSYLDSGLNSSTTYSYLLNITHNSTVYSNRTLSAATTSNIVQVTNQDLNNTLAQQLFYIQKISTAVEMIPVVLIYAIFMCLGFYMISKGSVFTGWTLYAASIPFDFLFTGLLYEQYSAKLTPGLTGQFIWLFLVGMVLWIGVKFIGLLRLQVRVKHDRS